MPHEQEATRALPTERAEDTRTERADAPAVEVPPLVQTAIHEAGHALMALYLGLPIVRMTVVPTRRNAGELVLGRVNATTLADGLAHVHRQIWLYVAGAAAESARFGEYGGGCQSDLEWAGKLVWHLSHGDASIPFPPTPDDIDRRVRASILSVAVLLTGPLMAGALVRLARAIMARGTMRRKEIVEVVGPIRLVGDAVFEVPAAAKRRLWLRHVSRDASYRADVVRLCRATGKTPWAIGREMGLSGATIRRWVRETEAMALREGRDPEDRRRW